MNQEQFYEMFENINAEIEGLKEAHHKLEEQSRQAKKTLEARVEMSQAIEGLKTTPSQRDPGKYQPAYWFVEEIQSDDIIGAKDVSLRSPCQTCNNQVTVIVKYEQTYDSPDGDTWEKTAYTICPEDGLTSIKRVSRDGRF